MPNKFLTIDYQDGEIARQIILETRNLSFFVEAAKDPEIAALQGDALVARLVEMAKGAIVEVTRLADDVIEDGPNGESAVVQYDRAGLVSCKRHYKNNELNDTESGDPAVQHFHQGKTLTRTERYQNGLLNDGRNGEPAFVAYGYRRTGLFSEEEYYIKQEKRYQEGLLNDGPNGEPAIVEFGDGVVTHTGYIKGVIQYERYFDGDKLLLEKKYIEGILQKSEEELQKMKQEQVEMLRKEEADQEAIVEINKVFAGKIRC